MVRFIVLVKATSLLEKKCIATFIGVALSGTHPFREIAVYVVVISAKTPREVSRLSGGDVVFIRKKSVTTSLMRELTSIDAV